MSPPTTPKDELGDDLWDALGAAAEPGGARFTHPRAEALRTEAVRDALGDDLWDALGALPVPAVDRQEPTTADAVRRVVQRRQWREGAVGAGGIALALAATALLVVVVRTAGTPEPIDDLAMLAELELVEHLELVADPDFDVLLRWDGRVP